MGHCLLNVNLSLFGGNIVYRHVNKYKGHCKLCLYKPLDNCDMTHNGNTYVNEDDVSSLVYCYPSFHIHITTINLTNLQFYILCECFIAFKFKSSTEKQSVSLVFLLPCKLVRYP